MTTVISIGRTVEQAINGPSERLIRPMSAEAWSQFRFEVRQTVPADQIVFAGTGVGFYEGQTEDSFTVIITGTLTRVERSQLGWLAFKYGQECIAVTEGETGFIEASSVVLRP